MKLGWKWRMKLAMWYGKYRKWMPYLIGGVVVVVVLVAVAVYFIWFRH